MHHTCNSIIKHKASLLNLAEELGNVSKACKVMGVSRDTFYRYQELVQNGGLDSLIDKSRRSPNVKKHIDPDIEQAVIENKLDIHPPPKYLHPLNTKIASIMISLTGQGHFRATI